MQPIEDVHKKNSFAARILLYGLFLLLLLCLIYGYVQWKLHEHTVAAQDSNIRQISYAYRHLCVVTTSGELMCWGDNTMGQIGNGKYDRTLPDARVLDPTLIIPNGVTAVSAGYAHTCAIVDGALDCWGSNTSIGIGRVDPDAYKIPTTKPIQIIASGVKAVAAGNGHTCAIVGEALQCWGANYYGQIGNGSSSQNVLKPMEIIASGVTAVAAAGHTCAVVRGDLLCWGDNRRGQVGDGTTGNNVLAPKKVISEGVSTVAVSNDNTCAIMKGALWCWGVNANGMLAPEATTIVSSPQQIIASGVTDVSMNYGSICAVVRGTLQCWGSNHGNTIGTGKVDETVPNPREVIPRGVTAVAMGENATCAVVGGALRCRGHDAYRQEEITHAEFSTFDQSAGDIKISHDVADAAVALEKMPSKIGHFLRNHIIYQGDAVYLVTSAGGGLMKYGSGRKEKSYLQLTLDVIPLLPVTLRSPSGGDAGASNVIIVLADAQCGVGGARHSSLSTTKFYVQSGNQFMGLKQALPPALGVLPEIESSADSFSMVAGDLAKIQTCAEKILVAADKRPFQSLQYEVGGENITAPPTMDGVWHHNGAGSVGSISIFPRAAITGDFTAQAQTLSAMQCGDTVLAHWKPWLSKPLDLQFAGSLFSVNHDSLEAGAREFPVYTLGELRRAINAEREMEGMASEEEARSCLPAIVGEHFSISHGGSVVQQIDINLEHPKALFHVDCAEGALCKPLPDNSGKSIVVFTPHSNGTSNFGTVKKSDDDADTMDESVAQREVYDLQVFIVKSGTSEVHGRLLQKQAYASNGKTLTGFEIDTGRYFLEPGIRAFGLRARYSASTSLSPAGETTLKLFVQNGDMLREVLSGLLMSRTGSEWSGSCTGHTAEIKRSIGIGTQSSHGLLDLVVTSMVTTTASAMVNGKCVDTQQKPRTEQDILHFDGEKYVIPAGLQAVP